MVPSQNALTLCWGLHVTCRLIYKLTAGNYASEWSLIMHLYVYQQFLHSLWPSWHVGLLDTVFMLELTFDEQISKIGRMFFSVWALFPHLQSNWCAVFPKSSTLVYPRKTAAYLWKGFANFSFPFLWLSFKAGFLLALLSVWCTIWAETIWIEPDPPEAL